MTGTLIDGKSIAAGMEQSIKQDIETVVKKIGRKPKLLVILASPDEASKIYVGAKKRKGEEIGIEVDINDLGTKASSAEISRVVQKANLDKSVDGMIVQLPLPSGISGEGIIEQINPNKDVDGLTPFNIGKLAKGGKPSHVPCTAMGIVQLIESTGLKIIGKNVTVVGRSNIVGKPVATLLLQRDATVTICHSKTVDLGMECKHADILIAAIGRPSFITKEWIKDGAVVIDVGINRTADGITGDVDFLGAKEIAGFITPVPGGVGPMTVINLMRNVVTAAKLGAGIE